MNNGIKSLLYVLIAMIVGVVCAYFRLPFSQSLASIISEIFLGLLKLISLPIIFLSIISTITGFKNLDEMKFLGTKILKYTLLTTLIAASTALGIFLLIQPVSIISSISDQSTDSSSLIQTLIEMIPKNIIQPFAENNVFGVALIALFLGLAILALPQKNKESLNTFFSSLFQALLKITSYIIKWIPIGIWAFVVNFAFEFSNHMETLPQIWKYVLCVLAANLIQGLIVLPIILKLKGISPIQLARSVFPALVTAFFSKSSSAALPLAIETVTQKSQVKPKVAHFSLPLCSVINMNACAAFILITVLFVSMSSGIEVSYWQMILWVFLATLAAIGNASVPMGCYFLASAFLVGMGAPLYLMGVILPIYAFLDMLETALNVWSDCSITKIIDKEVSEVETINQINN